MSTAPAHCVIVGCGRVGSSLARRLTAAGTTVAVIDKRRESFERFLADWSGPTIVGFGFDRDVLIEAGVERATGLAAVTSGDNSNIIVARIAKESYGVRSVVARIYDPQRASVYERLGIATVATTPWATEESMRHLLPGTQTASWTHALGGVAIVERVVSTEMVGKPAQHLDEAGGSRVIGLVRFGQASLVDPATILQEGDSVVVAVGAE